MDLELMVKKIVREALEGEKLQAESTSEEAAGNTGAVGKILVLIPENALNTRAFLEYIKKGNRACEMVAVTDDIPGKNAGYCRFINKNSPEERRSITEAFNEFQKIFCVSPALKMMSLLSQLDDGDFYTRLLVAGALLGKETCLLLDYDVRNAPAGELSLKVGELTEAIMSKGIKVKCIREEERPAFPKKALITAGDVEDLWNKGRKTICCEKGSIVTPLAADRAGELGMPIKYGCF